MATITDSRSVNATLSGTAVDTVILTQFWDAVEITNHSAGPIYIRFDAVDPADGQEGAYVVPSSSSKTFRSGDGAINWATGVAGSTVEATAPIRVRIIGNSNVYSVEGSSAA